MKTIKELMDLVNEVNIAAYEAATRGGLGMEIRFSWQHKGMHVTGFCFLDNEWKERSTTCFPLETDEQIQAAYWFLKTKPFGI